MMSSILGLVLTLVTVIVALGALKADEHYRHLHTLGQQDYIRHVDNSDKYKGLELWSYQRGWNKQAVIYGEKS